jgi:hypothetical protein
LSWDEVSLSLDPSSFNLFTVAERVLSLGDPMVRALSTGLDLDETLAKLGELITAGDAT